jgi:hypothetical protein
MSVLLRLGAGLRCQQCKIAARVNRIPQTPLQQRRLNSSPTKCGQRGRTTQLREPRIEPDGRNTGNLAVDPRDVSTEAKGIREIAEGGLERFARRKRFGLDALEVRTQKTGDSDVQPSLMILLPMAQFDVDRLGTISIGIVTTNRFSKDILETLKDVTAPRQARGNFGVR